MKMQWLLGMALCAAALGGQAQQAQQGQQGQQGDESVTIPAPRLTIDQPVRRNYIDPVELREYRGSYELSNGQILKLTGVGLIIYGEVGDMGQHRMVATRKNTFVALDRKLQVRINRAEDGEPGGEVLMAVPYQVAGSGEIAERVVRLAAR
ncbi:hypothetical protein GTP46_19130 [Duganella sp. FT135W]|uniref:Uncharacterized protein n=1 Tax=Duganella flavida TaxID=2692175 RepID=A0A6L8KBB6_9BURK|nr:hypothetical protein [Duganella flavida]MYM24753.1 hypothetical protein [Duganella flavida]